MKFMPTDGGAPTVASKPFDPNNNTVPIENAGYAAQSDEWVVLAEKPDGRYSVVKSGLRCAHAAAVARSLIELPVHVPDTWNLKIVTADDARAVLGKRSW